MKKLQFLKAGDYMKTITRAKYLDRIIELNGTPDIKIITGIRRSGKSKLMQAYIAYLKSNFENINIIFIDFMDLAYEEIKEYHALHAYVEEHYQEGKTNYLFVDEVQMCPKFELAINSLYSKGKYDIYVTGSNAFLLSADLATLFTGRYIEIHVFPFSFQEYCQYYDDISDKDKLFDEYAIKGGLAGSYAYRTEKDRTNYIKEVYETIVTRDLVQKYTLPDTLVLQRLSEFLIHHIQKLWNQFSQTNISHYLDTASFTGFFCHLVSGAQLLFNLNRSQVCSCSLMFNGFQLHFVGKSPFTGEQIFSLQIAVNHNNCGSIVIQVAHNDRHGFFSGQFAGSAASVTGYQLITAIRQWSGNRRNQHTILFDAVCGFYHCIIILDLEGVILERMQFR